ncbi:MFS transporter [Thiomicrorhabdus sp.]|uniref:MFS transporter n=1 Tax=Thiomicrorhabdus sp. TaxID=2039724 RepID=UPI0029C63C4F|nr:MFS transporter [Thiomicrorhabdus sp.]
MRSLLNLADFRAFFIVQFLGAFNDNLFKNALVLLITFKLSDSAEETGFLITLAAGLFILPFFLFSSFAGQLADHFCKTRMIRWVKFAEIVIMGLGAYGLLAGQLEVLFAALFLMGAQSTFFGPIKYSILPEIVPEEKLLRANAWVSGSTFIAILIGTILGGIGVMLDGGEEVMSLAVIVTAILGFAASFLINKRLHSHLQISIDWNPLLSAWRMMREMAQFHLPWRSLWAISWFWFLGAVLLSQIPNLVKYDLHADDQVVVAYLTLFSVGIAIGSALISKLMKNGLHLFWHALILLLMSLFLALAVWSIQLTGWQISTAPMGIGQLIVLWPANLSLVFLLLFSILGGAYIVPLYTLLQSATPEAERARMVAANNILNALFMVVSSLLLMLGYSLQISLLNQLLLIAVGNLLAVVLMRYFAKQVGRRQL